MKRFHQLDYRHEKILSFRETEPAYSGEYESCHQEGVYLCYQCDAPLYLSSAKFNSGCGWPSFDDEIEKAVTREPDPDGKRIEIKCASCEAHLGHVFLNEGFTPKMTRHCVNSASLRFLPAVTETGYENAYFAGGCFWGLEYVLMRQKGVVATRVGYMGGQVANPTYQEVCTASTGHAEVVHVCFDPKETTFEEVTKCFFEYHDPYDDQGQGPDRGPQYRSVIFCLSSEQREMATALKKFLGTAENRVVTSIEYARWFYPAETYHQHYYEKTNSIPYCHKYVQRFCEG